MTDEPSVGDIRRVHREGWTSSGGGGSIMITPDELFIVLRMHRNVHGIALRSDVLLLNGARSGLTVELGPTLTQLMVLHSTLARC